MRALIQRVSHSSVTICGELRSSIGKGLLILVGIGDDDSQEDIDYIVKKTVNLRVFDDSDGVMNLSLLDIKGDAHKPVHSHGIDEERQPSELYTCCQTRHLHPTLPVAHSRL